jgi:hypothetical protein
MTPLQRLPDIYLQPLVCLIDRIEPHPDFVYVVDTLERRSQLDCPKKDIFLSLAHVDAHATQVDLGILSLQ